MPQFDWLSQFSEMIAVTGRLEVHCVYGAPWRIARAPSGSREIPYYIVLEGRAIFEDAQTGSTRELLSGDILLLPQASAHVLHDGSGYTASHADHRLVSAGWTLSDNDGPGERLEMLCGRLFIEPPHDHLIRNYFPTHLVVRTMNNHDDKAMASASGRLALLLGLMRAESTSDKPGGYAIFNMFSSVMFTLALRAASESDSAPAGLAALAGDDRLVPAVSAMLADLARPWRLSELANVCGMRHDLFARRFRAALGRSAIELLTDLRMSMAANALRDSSETIKAVAGSVGYRSPAAFRRVFSERTGMTPGQWRHLAIEGE